MQALTRRAAHRLVLTLALALAGGAALARDTAPAAATPARALTRLAAARPSSPAKGSTMPRRSHSRPASCGCQWYSAEPAAVHSSPPKKRAASARQVASSAPGGTRRSTHQPHAPAKAKARLLNTSSAQGMPHSVRWSAKSCWCAVAGNTGPNSARASSAAAPSSRPASAPDSRDSVARPRARRGVTGEEDITHTVESERCRAVWAAALPNASKSRARGYPRIFGY